MAKTVEQVFLGGPAREKGDFGIEIETEGYRLPKLIEGGPWRVENDPSLRGDDNCEYVYKGTCNQDELIEHVTRLDKYITGMEGKTIFSRSTSTHIHLNCTKMNMVQLANMVCLAFTFNQVMSEWCGYDRSINFFALQVKDAQGVVEKVRSFFTNQNKMYLNDGVRYCSVNLASLGKYGSLEFRSMRGTLDADLLKTWTSMILALRDKALALENPHELMEHFSRNETEFFCRDTLGDALYDEFIKDEEGLEKVREGIWLAQDLAYCRDWDKFYAPVKRKPVERKPKVLLDDILDDGVAF